MQGGSANFFEALKNDNACYDEPTIQAVNAAEAAKVERPQYHVTPRARIIRSSWSLGEGWDENNERYKTKC